MYSILARRDAHILPQKLNRNPPKNKKQFTKTLNFASPLNLLRKLPDVGENTMIHRLFRVWDYPNNVMGQLVVAHDIDMICCARASAERTARKVLVFSRDGFHTMRVVAFALPDVSADESQAWKGNSGRTGGKEKVERKVRKVEGGKRKV